MRLIFCLLPNTISLVASSMNASLFMVASIYLLNIESRLVQFFVFTHLFFLTLVCFLILENIEDIKVSMKIKGWLYIWFSSIRLKVDRSGLRNNILNCIETGQLSTKLKEELNEDFLSEKHNLPLRALTAQELTSFKEGLESRIRLSEKKTFLGGDIFEYIQ